MSVLSFIIFAACAAAASSHRRQHSKSGLLLSKHAMDDKSLGEIKPLDKAHSAHKLQPLENAMVAPSYAINPTDDVVNWTMPLPYQHVRDRRQSFERRLKSNHFSIDELKQVMAGKTEGPLSWLTALGGGTGASIGGTGSSIVDHDLLRRMHYQDKAVMLLVLVVYLVALLFSASLTYRQASNNFPVAYYADPRFHNLAVEGHDLDAFLDVFNQAPKNITLKVAGFVPAPEDLDARSITWRGENYHVAFTFSLDLSPWVIREMQTTLDASSQQTRSLHEGLLPEDRSMLHYYLNNDQNDLAFVEFEKKVAWPDWEELATNIKHRIRQCGFTGVISVDRVESDELQVYKNKPWANFMHARATRVLCALSIVGWIAYVPYMWLRCKKVTIGSYHRVDMRISDYWPLIADKLGADGFCDNGDAPSGGVRGHTAAPVRASNASGSAATLP